MATSSPYPTDGKGQTMHLASGLPNTVLSEFRSRLVEGHAEQRLLDLLLEQCREETSSLITSRRWGVQTGKAPCQLPGRFLHSS